MFDFLHSHETLFFWLTIIGILGLLGSVILIPWILIQLPSDYFHEKERKKCPWGNCPAILRTIVIILKNIIGVILLISGFIMLFIPGQGLLTMIVGIVLMDFPYKYKLLRWAIDHPKILSTINALREKANKDPFIL